MRDVVNVHSLPADSVDT